MAEDISQVWSQYKTKIFEFIKSRVNDCSITEDITQDVFVKILQKIDSLQSKEKLQSWIYQIARNSIIDYYRQKRFFFELPELPEVIDSSNKKVLQDLSKCIMPMINKLPKHYKEAIIMYEFERKSHEDIARTKGISLSGSKSRVQRARALLKKEFTDCCNFEFDLRGRVFDYSKKAKNSAV